MSSVFFDGNLISSKDDILARRDASRGWRVNRHLRLEGEIGGTPFTEPAERCFPSPLKTIQRNGIRRGRTCMYVCTRNDCSLFATSARSYLPRHLPRNHFSRYAGQPTAASLGICENISQDDSRLARSMSFPSTILPANCTPIYSSHFSSSSSSSFFHADFLVSFTGLSNHARNPVPSVCLRSTTREMEQVVFR